MKNNVIELYPHTTSHNKARRSSYRYGRSFADHLLTIADTFATLSIGCCTLFCMYLAYTML